MKSTKFYLILFFSCFFVNHSLYAFESEWQEVYDDPRHYLAKLTGKTEAELQDRTDRESIFRDIFKTRLKKPVLSYEGEVKSWEVLCNVLFNMEDNPLIISDLFKNGFREGFKVSASRKPGQLKKENKEIDDLINRRHKELSAKLGWLMEKTPFKCSEFFKESFIKPLLREAVSGTSQERHCAIKLLDLFGYTHFTSPLNMWNILRDDAVEVIYPEDVDFCNNLSSDLSKTNLLTPFESAIIRDKIKADPRSVHHWFANLGYTQSLMFTADEMRAIDEELESQYKNVCLLEKTGVNFSAIRTSYILLKFRPALFKGGDSAKVAFGVLLKHLGEK